MREFLSLAVMCSLAFPAMALAEEPVAPKQPAEQQMPEPPKTAADEMGKAYAPEAAEEGEHPFLDGLSWQVMASAFYRLSGYIDDGVVAGSYNALGYPYTQYNGFGLNFVGGMAQYTGDKFGVTVDLRWGTAAPLLTPAAPVKQGYVSWFPSDKVALDVGFFDTIFGAEVADEWENANYSRGALYFLRQPFNHMGVRSAFELADKVGFTLMVTNGGVLGGTPVDDNETPSIGWQFAFAPSDDVGLYIGGNHGASGLNKNKDWESFFDVVLSVNVDWFTLLFNGDYQVNPNTTDGAGGPQQTSFLYGHSLALIFDASDKVSIGLRGEHLSGNDNWRVFDGGGFGGLSTATITLRYKPIEYLVFSVEGRGEWATRQAYFSRAATTVMDPGTMEEVLVPNKKQSYAVILGASAHFGN